MSEVVSPFQGLIVWASHTQGSRPGLTYAAPSGLKTFASSAHEAGLHDLPRNAGFGIGVGRRNSTVQFPFQFVAEFGSAGPDAFVLVVHRGLPPKTHISPMS